MPTYHGIEIREPILMTELYFLINNLFVENLLFIISS